MNLNITHVCVHTYIFEYLNIYKRIYICNKPEAHCQRRAHHESIKLDACAVILAHVGPCFACYAKEPGFLSCACSKIEI